MSDSIQLLSSWLLTYAVHSTLLIGAAWLISRNARRLSMIARDTMWKAALYGGIFTASLQVGLGVAPVTGTMTLGIQAADVVDAEVAAAQFATPGIPVDEPLAVSVEADATEFAHTQPTADMSATSIVTDAPKVANPMNRLAQVLALAPWQMVILLLWIVGVTIGLARLTWARLRLHQCLRDRRPIADPHLRRAVGRFSALAGVRRHVRLSWSPTLTAPAALTSEICLPKRALLDMSLAQHRSVIAHEIAHIVRRDPLWFALNLLVERLFFFQPLNIFARERLQEIAEYLCDDWSVQQTGTKLTLAESLAEVAGWLTNARPIPMLPTAGQNGSELIKRVERILAPGHAAAAWSARPSRAITAVAVLLLVGVSLPGVSCARTAQTPTLVAEPEELLDQSTAVDLNANAELVSPEMVLASPEMVTLPLQTAPGLDLEPQKIFSNAAELVADKLPGWRPDLAGAPNAAWLAEGGVLLDQWNDVDAVVVGSGETILSGAVAQIANQVLQVSGSAVVAPLLRQSPQQSSQDPRVIAGLIRALNDEDAEVRMEAASALGKIGDSTAVAPLIRVLSDANPKVRVSAASSLGRLRAIRALDALVKATSDPAANVRKAAIRALARFRDQRAVPALIRALSSNSPDVRELAADALGDLKDPRAVEPLIGALSDPTADVREQALGSLYNLRDTRAIPPIIEALHDQSAEVRRMAASALGRLGDRRAVPGLIQATTDTNAKVRRYAVGALGRLHDDRAVEPLIAALSDQDRDVRATAVRALARLRDND